MFNQAQATRTLYWLVDGNAPNGPFDVAQLHAKPIAGEITWQTLACPVGGSAWVPLINVPGLGPTIVPPTDAIQASLPVSTKAIREPVLATLPAGTSGGTSPGRSPPDVSPADPLTSSSPAQSSPGSPLNPQAPRRWPQVLFAVAGVLIVVWLMYSWFRPLSPREVCDRFGQAKTLKEMSQYTTLNLLPALTEMSKQQTPETDDPFELTQEGEAPAEVGGYLIGCRWQIYIPEERRRIQFDGVIHLIRSGGWKIEDIYILAMDRHPLELPFSMAANYQLLLEQSKEVVMKPTKEKPASTSAKTWNEQRHTATAIRVIGAVVNSKAAKTIGVVLAGICLAFSRFGAGVLALFTSRLKKKDTI